LAGPLNEAEDEESHLKRCGKYTVIETVGYCEGDDKQKKEVLR
jgi:hypothetical protein